jgi:hypothetical protein
LRHQSTESLPRVVSSSLAQYLRLKCKLPQRLTQKLGVLDAISYWYAPHLDAKLKGETILTEFVAE